MGGGSRDGPWRASEADARWVEDALARPPRIPWRVAARASDGRPIVIELAPHDLQGAPQSNWFWLVDRRLARAVARLESAGGVRVAQAAVAPRALALSHRSYATALPEALRRAGRGVGGASAGVKCLHAHLAFLLVGGFAPVGVLVRAWLAHEDPALAAELVPQ